MCQQQAIPLDRVFDDISFQLHGCDYKIKHDANRDRLQPAWYVQRMSDKRYSKRYYTWPDGAFSAVFWGRVVWE